MGRCGRTSWIVRVNPTRLEAIRLAVAEGGTARDLFLRFSLGQVVKFQTFRRWVTIRRRELATREGAGPPHDGLQDMTTAARARWGNRGLRRIRRGGRALISREDGEIVAGLTLVDCADELRLIADCFVDVARALIRMRAASGARTEGVGAPGAG